MTRPTHGRELPSRSAVDVPAGWPRPYSRPTLEGVRSTPQYVQWIATFTGDQITSCHSERTWMAGAYNLCSSCGALMESGVVFDRDWVNTNVPAEHRGRKSGPSDIGGRLGDMDAYDTHYGSPLCLRCTVFALKHCPFFSTLDEVFGDTLVWFLIGDVTQYREFDETSGIEVVDPGAVPRVTSGWVRKQVRDGRLRLVHGVTAEDLPALTRPPEFVDGKWVKDPWKDQPKVPLGEARRLAEIGLSGVPGVGE